MDPDRGCIVTSGATSNQEVARKDRPMSKRSDANNHANQLNKNNEAYRSSRGLPAPPADPGPSPGATPAPTATPGKK